MAKAKKGRAKKTGDGPEKPPQPHDALVKKIFGDPENARVELQAVLPRELVAAIDWSTLEVLPDTFIDSAVAQTQADLLFRVKLASRDARIYVVFEHKSEVKASTLVQVGRYVMDVLIRYFAQGGKVPAPVVIPVVLHHSNSGWTVAQRFHELFDAEVLAVPGVREHVPDFRVALDDISKVSDDELRSRAQDAASLIVPLTLWALRDARRGTQLVAALAAWAHVIGEISRLESGRDALFAVLSYISMVNEAISPQDLQEALALAPQETKDAIMTLAEQWMAQGRAQGEAKGRVEGERRTLERLLRRKFGDASVNESLLARLSAAGEEQLAEWTDRVLDAQRVEEIFS